MIKLGRLLRILLAAMTIKRKITRANAGHAVLQSTPKPPKMRRRNGPTERRTDGRTDRPSYRGASQQRERAKRKKSEVLKLEERNKEEIGDEREEPSSHNEMASVRLVCARESDQFSE